jgi:hypothetical protein
MTCTSACSGVLLDWDAQGSVAGPAIDLALQDAQQRWFPETDGVSLNWIWHDE